MPFGWPYGGTGGWVLGGRGAVLGGQRGTGYRWASAIDLIYRIKMVVARASGMDLASILKRNTFLTLGVCPVGGRGVRGPARDGGTEGPRDGGTQKGPGTGGHKRAPSGAGRRGGTPPKGGWYPP